MRPRTPHPPMTEEQRQAALERLEQRRKKDLEDALADVPVEELERWRRALSGVAR